MNSILKLYFTLIITNAVNKLEKDSTLTFINIYCGKDIYNVLITYEYTLDDGKKLYFKLDANKPPTEAGFELETEKNLDKWDDVFE